MHSLLQSRAAWVLTLLICLGGSCDSVAGITRHDRPDSQYITLANASQFAAVGQVGGASGVLIGSDWVLTAAHVDGPLFIVGGTSYSVAESIPHPQWNNDLALGYDLRLLRLDTPVVGIDPMRINGYTDELGRHAISVGYGKTGTGLTGDTGAAGTKRAFENVLDLYGKSSGTPNEIVTSLTEGRLILADFDHPSDPSKNVMGSAAPLDLEGQLGTFDSGGGTCIQLDGQWLLAGVNSFVVDVDEDGTPFKYGDAMGVTRLSSHVDWLYTTSGISAVPEPSTLLLSAVGLAGIVWARWRRRRT